MELLRVWSLAATGLDWLCIPAHGATLVSRSPYTPSSQGIQAWAENRMVSQELAAWVAALSISSDTWRGGNCRGRREEAAGCGLCVTSKTPFPVCWGASLPLCLQLGPCTATARPEPASLGDGRLPVSPLGSGFPEQNRGYCVPCPWVWEEGSQPGTDPGSLGKSVGPQPACHAGSPCDAQC